jgi:hypothetical protein
MPGFGAVGQLSVGQFSSGGSTYNQTISAIGSGAVTFRRDIGKFVLPNSAAAVSIQRAISRTVAATATGSVTVTKSVGKFVRLAGAGVVAVTTPIIRFCAVFVSGSGAVSMVRDVGKIVGVTPNSVVTFARAIAFTVAASAVGAVTISTLSLIVATVRRPLYLRGRSFWRGR